MALSNGDEPADRGAFGLPRDRNPLRRMWRFLRHLVKISAAQTSPARLALTVFTAMILLVTLLLMLPVASQGDQPTSFVDALFTAVSAVCVTGLTTVETASHWSMFGLVVIMIAIKTGGLGVLTLASLLSLSVSRHMGLAQRVITASETRAQQLGEVASVLKTIVITSTTFELLTSLILLPRMLMTGEYHAGRNAFNALFYGISAFNNAGFVPEISGTQRYMADPWFSLPIATAVLIGSLGFPVILVVVRKWDHPSKWSLHAKLTIATTLILLCATVLVFAVLEWDNPLTLGGESFGAKLNASLFAGVMPRSGGFSTVPVGELRPGTLLVLDALMFIGGGSGSTAGGIKVTTFALLVLSIVAEARGDRDVEVFGRRIPHNVIRQAIAVLVISVVIVFTSTFLLLEMTGIAMDQVIFEVLSAFATVGLSTGITPGLKPAAKFVLILCMYLGRIGPMTLGAALALRNRQRVIRLPEDRPIVG